MMRGGAALLHSRVGCSPIRMRVTEGDLRALTRIAEAVTTERGSHVGQRSIVAAR